MVKAWEPRASWDLLVPWDAFCCVNLLTIGLGAGNHDDNPVYSTSQPAKSPDLEPAPSAGSWWEPIQGAAKTSKLSSSRERRRGRAKVLAPLPAPLAARLGRCCGQRCAFSCAYVSHPGLSIGSSACCPKMPPPPRSLRTINSSTLESHFVA